MNTFECSDRLVLPTDEVLLPFTVDYCSTEEDWRDVLQLRSEAYARHLPQFAQDLQHRDAVDFDPATTVLIARSKIDRRPLGTLRIEIKSGQGLRFESSFQLPPALKAGANAEISRLAVTQAGQSHNPRMMLIKAAYWYCRSLGVQRLFICARKFADRQYRPFDMQDLTNKASYIPMAHIGDIPHRILWIDVYAVQQQWTQSRNPTLMHFYHTAHPDLLNGIQEQVTLMEQGLAQQAAAG